MKLNTPTFLTETVLKKNIAELGEKFKKIGFHEAHEIGLSQRYNYLYTGETLYFLGCEVEKLALKVKKDVVIESHFEISYENQETLFNKLIEKHGYPDSGHINPSNFPLLKNPSKGRKEIDNYYYENYTGLTWQIDDSDVYMSITNLANNEYFIEKTSILWINFQIAKD